MKTKGYIKITKHVSSCPHYAHVVVSLYKWKIIRSFDWIEKYAAMYVAYFKIVWPGIVRDSLWIKPTDALNYSFIGITTIHVSGGLSTHHQEFLAVYLFWYILCSCDDRLLPRVGWNCLQFHPTLGSTRSSHLHKMYQSRCTAKNSWWWAERLPETCRVVIPIKLEFSASVGFIHTESVTIHGHAIIKFKSKIFSP